LRNPRLDGIKSPSVRTNITLTHKRTVQNELDPKKIPGKISVPKKNGWETSKSDKGINLFNPKDGMGNCKVQGCVPREEPRKKPIGRKNGLKIWVTVVGTGKTIGWGPKKRGILKGHWAQGKKICTENIPWNHNSPKKFLAGTQKWGRNIWHRKNVVPPKRLLKPP